MAGRMKYITPELIRELQQIKLSEGIQKDSEAQRILVQNSIVGRELDKLNFLHPKKKRR